MDQRLVSRPPPSLSMAQWQVMRQQAAELVKSGFLPNGITTPEKALAVIQTGRELGIPPMYALRNITVINGRPTLSAQLMQALIYRDCGPDALVVTESTDTVCTVEWTRRAHTGHMSFTMEQAKKAELTNKENWRHYPAAMLRARCISMVATTHFPDVIGGMYTPEELGAGDQEPGGDADTVDATAWEVTPEPELIGPLQKAAIEDWLTANGYRTPPARAAWLKEQGYDVPRVGALTAEAAQAIIVRVLNHTIDPPSAADDLIDAA